MRVAIDLLQKYFRWIVLFILFPLASCTTVRPPSLIPFDDGEYWVLGSELVFTIRETGQRIVVPRGFVTDFASVPRIFWTFFPKHGEYTRAAIVHDFLYWQQQCTREQADELFDIVMADSDVDTTSRYTIYAAVRVWGDDAWEGNTEAKADGYLRIIPEHYMNFPVKTRWLDYREFLRKMQEDSEQDEEFPISTPPQYCSALQGKDTELEKDSITPAEDVPEGNETEVPRPEDTPLPESAIGA